jgi:hypothetical protein
VLELLAQRAFEPLSPSPYKLELTPMVPPTTNAKLPVIEESKREASSEAATKKMEMIFKKRKPVQFTLNTGQCRSELELIQFVAEINGKTHLIALEIHGNRVSISDEGYWNPEVA